MLNEHASPVQFSVKPATGGSFSPVWTAGSTTVHVVAAVEVALEVAVRLPSVPAATGPAESASRLAIRPEPVLATVLRGVTPAGAVHEPTEVDLVPQ